MRNDDTQDNLAHKLCVSRQLTSKWERGISTPDLKNTGSNR